MSVDLTVEILKIFSLVDSNNLHIGQCSYIAIGFLLGP